MLGRNTNFALKVMLGASVIVPMLFFCAVAWRNGEQVFEEARRHIDRTVALLHEHARKGFETYTFVLEVIDDRTRGLDWDTIGESEEVHRFLRRVDHHFEQIDSLWMSDPTGKSRASSRFFPLPEVNISDRDYFRAIQGGARQFVSETFTGRLTGIPAFNIAYCRPGADDGFNGVIVVSVFVNYFLNFYGSVSPGIDDVVSLTRSDGAVLVHYPTLGERMPRLSPQSGLMRAIAEVPAGGQFRAHAEADGVERIYGYRKLGNFPVYVSYGIDVSAIWRKWRDNMAYFAIFAVLSSMLLLLVTGLVHQRARRERLAVARLREEMERRESTEAMLRKSQKLELLGRITGGIAHDFNNLLMVITSNLYLAKTRCEDAQIRAFVETADQAAYRGGQLTKQLLAFTRQQTLNPEPFDLNDCLDTMIGGMLKRSLRGDIRIEADLSPDLWPIRADRGQLELAVLNMAVNSRDAMPNGGLLRLTTRNVRFNDDHPGPSGLIGDFVAIGISDSGHGIDPAILDQVFEPFFTTKEVGKGTGLGLSMVHGFARQSGGAIQIESEPGKGTAISLFLPRTGADPVPGAEPAPARAVLAGNGAILVVEDGAEIGSTVTRLLRDFGYTVQLADNARTALAILARGERFDLVFSDIVMPGGMNGFELAREIRRCYPRLPVLLTTGYSGAAGNAMAEGFQVLRKPYRPEVLAEAVRDVIRAAAYA